MKIKLCRCKYLSVYNLITRIVRTQTLRLLIYIYVILYYNLPYTIYRPKVSSFLSLILIETVVPSLATIIKYYNNSGLQFFIAFIEPRQLF